MEQAKIDRINAYARRVKAGEALTPAEEADRAAQRAEYVAAVRNSLEQQFDHTHKPVPDGPPHRQPKKEE